MYHKGQQQSNRIRHDQPIGHNFFFFFFLNKS